MILSDPEVESAVLISSDEGASFEKHPINFHILSLLFHPAQENWILAYSHDNKVDQKVKEVSCKKSVFMWCDDYCAAHFKYLHPKSVSVRIGLTLSCSSTVQWTLGGNGSLFTTTWCQDDSTGIIARLLFLNCYSQPFIVICIMKVFMTLSCVRRI